MVMANVWHFGRQARMTTNLQEFRSCYLCCKHCIELLLSVAMDCGRNFCGWQGRHPDGLSRFKRNSAR